MGSSDSFVKFDKVDKSYDGEILVVKDLNVDIPKGEFLTMLGPSGSGKTTTLMMLAGFETPTGGEIYLDGEAINKIPPYKRGIGMVFQNYALFPHMTVQENLAFPLEVRKLNKSDVEDKVKKALDMVELGAFGNRMPLQLSGGQQQRVALARALVFEPRLVLMDEPLGLWTKNFVNKCNMKLNIFMNRLELQLFMLRTIKTKLLQCQIVLQYLMMEKFNRYHHQIFYMKNLKMHSLHSSLVRIIRLKEK